MRSSLFRTVFGVSCLFATVAHGGDIAELLVDGSFWEKPVAENRQFMGVRYAPVADQTMRVPASGGLSIAKLKMGETLLEMDEEKKPVAVTVMVYNKGDNGNVDKKEFDEYVAGAIAVIDELTGVKGKSRKVSKKDSAVKINAVQWVWENGAARLESSATTDDKGKSFQPEFIRLKLGADAEALERGGASDVIARSKLRGNIKKLTKGCVIEGIPMVDQGQKGYCVPATLSRLFAYYGMDGVDQHALAALCKSSGASGTNSDSMETALNDISRAFHIRMQSVPVKNLLKDYNKAAKKAGVSELTQQQLDLGYPFESSVLKSMMDSKNANSLIKKWVNPVAKCIDTGIPVVWSVMLGIYPEPGLPQTSGGHMRMIIGYDWEKEEIVYSDTWGQGHEAKRMPMKQAIVITRARYILRPSR